MASELSDILDQIERHHPKANLALIEKAYQLSKEAHEGQKRKSGDPYFIHPVGVAYILASHGMDEVTVATGLLHDVVEDTLTTVDEIKKQFGNDVAQLVDGVTKLSKISFRSKDVRQAESFRKMLLAMGQDIRVIIVKLADRLHNMRTLDHMASMKQLDIAQETIDIYAPLANRLGISWLKLELEELAFKALKPSSYKNIEEQLATRAAEQDKFIARVIDLIAKKMLQEGVRCEVSGRHKNVYSIFKKMESRNLDFDQVTDILAFRIIVENVSQCYEALGHIHATWKPVPGRFKDYIALPKANLYQSLHTTVIGPEGKRVEVQIRTREMHRLAEEGIAAHWLYKAPGVEAKKGDIHRFGWLRNMVESQEDLPDSHEFIETMKIDLFADEVYVFSPRGEVLDFPRGSTPIDFAYRIHTEVGHKTHGARANGRMVPLKYKIQNGDTIEIITAENARPTKDWLKIAVTSKAKSKIRAVIKQEQRETGRVVGREMLERELKKHHENYEKLLKVGKLKTAADDLGYDSIDEMLLGVGYGKLAPSEILPHLLPPGQILSAAAEADLRAIVSKGTKRVSAAIKVGGVDDVMVRYGKCCGPLPGDPILGFVTRGRGVTVHRTDCYKVLEVDNARKVDVDWDRKEKSAHSVRIKVISRDTPGILANISNAISQKGGNISHASIKTTQDQKAINTFDVDVNNTEQLFLLMQSIEQLGGIISVERVKA